jgi:hypothetical protein
VVRHFADVAGYEGVLILVTFNKSRFDRACRRYGLTPAEDDSYGESIVDVPVAMVWIDRAANPTAARLIRTAAHEALHVAQPALRHGRAFEKSVTCLTKGREP